MARFISLLFLTFLINTILAFEPHFFLELNNFKNSGNTKCKYYERDKLINVLEWNSELNTFTKFWLSSPTPDTLGPMYDDKYYIHAQSTYFMNSGEQIDSVLQISFRRVFSDNNIRSIDFLIDTSLSVYNVHVSIEGRINSILYYRIENGQRLLTKEDKLFYNELGQLKTKVYGDGRITSNYIYDEKGNMIIQSYLDVEIRFYYDSLNLPNIRKTNNSEIRYFYDKKGLKIREEHDSQFPFEAYYNYE